MPKLYIKKAHKAISYLKNFPIAVEFTTDCRPYLLKLKKKATETALDNNTYFLSVKVESLKEGLFLSVKILDMRLKDAAKETNCSNSSSKAIDDFHKTLNSYFGDIRDLHQKYYNDLLKAEKKLKSKWLLLPKNKQLLIDIIKAKKEYEKRLSDLDLIDKFREKITAEKSKNLDNITHFIEAHSQNKKNRNEQNSPSKINLKSEKKKNTHNTPQESQNTQKDEAKKQTFIGPKQVTESSNTQFNFDDLENLLFMDFVKKYINEEDKPNGNKTQDEMHPYFELNGEPNLQGHLNYKTLEECQKQLEKLKKRNEQHQNELMDKVGEENFNNTNPKLIKIRKKYAGRKVMSKTLSKELKESDKTKSKIAIGLFALIEGSIFNYEKKVRVILLYLYNNEKRVTQIIDKITIRLGAFKHDFKTIHEQINQLITTVGLLTKKPTDEAWKIFNACMKLEEKICLNFERFFEATLLEEAKQIENLIGELFQKYLDILGDISPGIEDESSDKIGFEGKKNKEKGTSSEDGSSETPQNSSEKSVIGDNVAPNKTVDEEYTYVIDPITKKPVKKKVTQDHKPLTQKEVEKQLKDLQKYTVILPESDYFISQPNPQDAMQFPEYFVIDGTDNHKVFIESQKYWTKKLYEFYSNPFKKGPVVKPKPIDTETSDISVFKLIVYTTALAVIIKNLNKFKGKVNTVQNKIIQKKSGKLSRIKLKSSNHKKLSRIKNVSNTKVKAKITKGGLSLNGKNIGQSNSNGNPKLNSAGKGNGQGGSNKVGTRISGRPAVGRCKSWYRNKFGDQYSPGGTPMLNNGAGGAGGPYANSKY